MANPEAPYHPTHRRLVCQFGYIHAECGCLNAKPTIDIECDKPAAHRPATQKKKRTT